MIMKIKKNRIKILMVIFVLIIVIFIYNAFYNINNLSRGSFIEELSSPNKQYTLKAYLISGDSLSANSVRVELVNNSTQEVSNIYFNYPESEVEMYWLDQVTVEINEIKLNIFEDIYDWRKNR